MVKMYCRSICLLCLIQKSNNETLTYYNRLYCNDAVRTGRSAIICASWLVAQAKRFLSVLRVLSVLSAVEGSKRGSN